MKRVTQQRIVITTEGTYPFSAGGVSTWCDMLISRLPEFAFTVYAVITNPWMSLKYSIPNNVAKVQSVPLWGTEEPSEHIVEIPFSRVFLSKAKTDESAIKKGFLPHFSDLLDRLLEGNSNDISLGLTFSGLHEYFKEYDYRETFKHPLTWEMYASRVAKAANRQVVPVPSIHETTQTLGWLYRFFTILATPVPKCDIMHSTAAAFCGLPCVLAKIEHNTPFILTEHGIYVREQHLAAIRTDMTAFTKRFFINLVTAIAGVNYAYADIVSPVCEFNSRWERHLGVPSDRIRVIYNGVDPSVFQPGPPPKREYPLVVTVARIDPLKDIETLLRTADIVRSRIPDVRFRIYGAASDAEYMQKCQALHKSLGLANTVEFMGHVDVPADAYRQGDLVLLTSISEGFPYTVIEAMMCGRAVVATDVGGVREAVGIAGLVVDPRNPAGLADACVSLISDGLLREEMALAARERALSLFSLDSSVDGYRQAYRSLSTSVDLAPEQKAPPRPSVFNHPLEVERALEHMRAEQYSQAADLIGRIVAAAPCERSVPDLLQLAAIARKMNGDDAAARLELDRLRALEAFKLCS